MTARRNDSRVEIDRPAEEVWAFVTDLGRWPEWRTTITTIDPPASLTVGEGFSGTTHIIGRTWHWQLELTVVEPNVRLAYDVVKGVAKPTVEYHLESLGDRCRFTMTGTIDRMGFLGRILAPVALPALRRESAAHVQNLKRILEHEDGLDR